MHRVTLKDPENLFYQSASLLVAIGSYMSTLFSGKVKTVSVISYERFLYFFFVCFFTFLKKVRLI